MKRQILFSIAFALLTIGCKKEVPKPTAPIDKEAKPEVSKKECYSYEANGSIVEMQLHYNPNDVTGSLNYTLAEKDRNEGTFKGKIENNILIADYTFKSEGTQSVRQVAFEFKDGKLIEGYGDMTSDGTHFKDISKLKFTSTMPLNKVVCPE